MKAKLYVRAARGRRGVKVAADNSVRHTALTEVQDRHEVALPTVAFAVEVEIPDAMFRQAEQVAARVELTPEAGEVIVRPLVDAHCEEAPNA